MYETTHRVIKNDKVYEYPAIKSAIRGTGIRGYKSFMRIYGINRTKEEAIRLVQLWENENPHQYKKRV